MWMIASPTLKSLFPARRPVSHDTASEQEEAKHSANDAAARHNLRRSFLEITQSRKKRQARRPKQ